MPGCVKPSSGSDDVHDALMLRVHAVAGDAELFAVLLQLRHLIGGDGIEDGQRAVGGGDAVIGGGEGQVGAADFQAARAQAAEKACGLK